MKTIIVHAESGKMKKITQYLKGLDVTFELADENGAYDSDFVEKIKRSRKQFKEGSYNNVAQEDLEKFLKS